MRYNAAPMEGLTDRGGGPTQHHKKRGAGRA